MGFTAPPHGDRWKADGSKALFLLVVLGLGWQMGAATQTSEPAKPGKATYVGSEQCKKCHEAVYNAWKTTRMANVVRDPKAHPEAVLGDFSHPSPIRDFDLDQVAFVYGSRYKQRYFTKRGDDYFPLPAQWDIAKQRWLPYHVEAGTDWWVPYYGTTNFDRPTGPTCDGCHSVGYDVETKQVAEWNVGCEKCHGPGSLHRAHPTADNVVNPGKLDYVRGNDVCMQCHTQGRPLKNPIHGRYYDWPVGFLAGDRLADFWQWRPTFTSSLTSPPTRTVCRETTSCRAPCITVNYVASIAMTSMATTSSRT